MAALQRFGALALELPFMDHACRDFLGLLARVDASDDARLRTAWDELVAFTDERFAREDVWMRTTGFSSRKEHMVQHRVVLEVMREGALRAARGDAAHVREMARQLRDWHQKHVQSMDAALALHLRGMRFAPANAGRLSPACRPAGAG